MAELDPGQGCDEAEDSENRFRPSQSEDLTQSMSMAMGNEAESAHWLVPVLEREMGSESAGEPAGSNRSQTGGESTDSYLRVQRDLRSSIIEFSGESGGLETSKEILQRIEFDSDPDKFTIGYINKDGDESKILCFWRANDNAHKVDVNCHGLPDPEAAFKHPEYLFTWIPKKPGTADLPSAGLLKVLSTFYVVLDTSTSPPRAIKLVVDEPSPIHYDASFIYRFRNNEKEVLFFYYEKVFYVIKPDNGVVTVEGHPKIIYDYMWKTSTQP